MIPTFQSRFYSTVYRRNAIAVSETYHIIRIALYVISRWTLQKAFLRGFVSFCKLIVLFSIVRIVFLLLLTFLVFLLLLSSIKKFFSLCWRAFCSSCFNRFCRLCCCWRPAVAIVSAGVPDAHGVPALVGVPVAVGIPTVANSSLLRMLPEMFKLSLLASLMFLSSLL